MAKEFQINLPFKECKKCPLANIVIACEKDEILFPSDAIPTKLESISLACAVINTINTAFLGGVRINSYVLEKKETKPTEYKSNSIYIQAGNPPDFCPQLEK